MPNDESNDGDLKLGYTRFGTKDWLAFEPIPPQEGEPISGTYPNNNNYGAAWKSSQKSCSQAYWNDDVADPDRPNWAADNGAPPSIPLAPGYWVKGNPGQGYASTSDCTPTLTHGILPLQGVRDAASKQLVVNSIEGLYAPPGSVPKGNTNAPQGLYWAWEVLMAGEPFNEAKASTPFTRTQAIVLLTDGQITGENGDAYKGVFGPDNGAGTTNKHGKISGTTNNNLNERLKKLAATIKGADPAKGVKIYVVQYDDPSTSLKTLLQSVATEPGAPYYYQANDSGRPADRLQEDRGQPLGPPPRQVKAAASPRRSIRVGCRRQAPWASAETCRYPPETCRYPPETDLKCQFFWGVSPGRR
ncbi:MAG: hypothetical protein IPK59_18800 [Rhodospirillaceae bacterium]|nr:hypothetical protein [Rhodospirillaceae bacterium]